MTAAIANPIDEVERLHTRRAEQFKALASRAAAGETISVEELDAALTASNKTPAQYRQLVERITRRNQLRETMQKREGVGPAVTAAQEQLAAATAQLEQEIQAARAKYDAAAVPLQEAIAAAHRQAEAAASAERELRDTASDELKKRLRQLQLQLNAWENNERRRIDDLEEALLRLKAERAETKDKAEIERLDNRMANCRREIEPLRAQGGQLHEQLNAVSQAMLTED